MDVREPRPQPSAAATGPGSLLLAKGTRLLHIGPPKTGTTALQSAFFAARAAADAQGVHYAGSRRHSIRAVQAVLGRRGFNSDEGPPSIRHWNALVSEVRRSRADRVVLSSEFFADARPDAMRRIVDDLDPVRLHVVVTLRPLVRIIPSQWQQYVQSGIRVGYDDWLEAMFRKPAGTITPSFWHRHRHDRLVARWAELVGAGNVTVIALDESDRAMVLRTFELLTGLRPGTLDVQPDLANRSLTLSEAEAIRAFNIQFRRERLGRALHSRVMNFGAARYMKLVDPPTDAWRVEPPAWVVDRATGIAREMVATIRDSGVRVVGDLDALATVPARPVDGQPVSPAAVEVTPEIAARMAMGVMYASGAVQARPRWPPILQYAEPPELVRLPTPTLISILAARIRAAIVDRFSSRLPARRR